MTETLLERRIKVRDYEVQELLVAVDHLRRVLAHQKEHGHDPGELARATAVIVNHAHLTNAYARMVEDLNDVATYGPEGGR